eukprot:g5155.t1
MFEYTVISLPNFLGSVLFVVGGACEVLINRHTTPGSDETAWVASWFTLLGSIFFTVAAASLLEAESFAAQRVQLSDELQELRAKCVEVIEELAEKNPTAQPTIGWRGYAGEPPKNSPLNGTWELLFTDAADATFKKGKRGSAKTFQEIDAELGWFINCVDFSNEKSKLRGFRVFVEGKALSDDEIELIFRTWALMIWITVFLKDCKVRLLRRSRFLPEITIPLPGPGLLRAIGRLFARSKGGKVNESNRGAGFKLLYVDDDLRMHKTFDGLYFVQRRLH